MLENLKIMLLQTNHLEKSNLGRMAQWAKVLQMNRKVPNSNATKRSTGFREPTLLQGPQ